MRVRAIRAACRLGIPGLLAGGARTAEELAEASDVGAGVAPTAAGPWGLDVVAADGDRFALTPLGRSLCPRPHSAAPAVMVLDSPALWSAWGALGDAVTDGDAS